MFLFVGLQIKGTWSNHYKSTWFQISNNFVTGRKYEYIANFCLEKLGKVVYSMLICLIFIKVYQWQLFHLKRLKNIFHDFFQHEGQTMFDEKLLRLDLRLSKYIFNLQWAPKWRILSQ